MECPPDFGAGHDSGETARIVDAVSVDLIDEFRAHLGGFPPETDHRLVFEGWALQKIAGLQVVVMDLAERLEDMEDGFYG